MSITRFIFCDTISIIVYWLLNLHWDFPSSHAMFNNIVNQLDYKFSVLARRFLYPGVTELYLHFPPFLLVAILAKNSKIERQGKKRCKSPHWEQYFESYRCHCPTGTYSWRQSSSIRPNTQNYEIARLAHLSAIISNMKHTLG